MCHEAQVNWSHVLSFVLLVSSSIGQAENLTPFDQTDVGSGFGLNFETTTAEQKEVEAITIANSYEESNISTTKDFIEAAISESFESDTVSSSVKDWPTSEVEGSGGEVVIEDSLRNGGLVREDGVIRTTE